MLSLVHMNSGGNGGEYRPPTTTDPDYDPDPDPGGRPVLPPSVVESPFPRHHDVNSITTDHLRAA